MSTTDEIIHSDVAVVGAGLAGLTAARLLRDAGHQVVVIDAATPGGRARSDLRSGAVLNRGPRAIYCGGPAAQVLGSLGVRLAGGPPAGTGAAVRHGEVHPLPSGIGALARTRLLSARGKAALARLMLRLDRIETDRLAAVPFAAWLDEQGLPDDARGVVEMLGRIASYSHAADVASAEMMVRQMQMAMRDGVRYLDGGWQAIVDHLSQGIRVLRGAVDVVEADGHGVEVRTADGRAVRAAAAVVAVGTPAAAGALLDLELAGGPPVEASCLDLVTSRPSKPALLFGIDRPLYLSNHCPPARLAPPGLHVVHVLRSLEPGEAPAPAVVRAELEAHAALAGLGDDVIVDRRHLHRMTVVGALAVAAHGGMAGRPPVQVAGRPGVFLAGDWVGPVGHLLDASIASAQEAARCADRAVAAVTLVRR